MFFNECHFFIVCVSTGCDVDPVPCYNPSACDDSNENATVLNSLKRTHANENVDEGSKGNWVNRTRTFYCNDTFYINNHTNRVFTCKTGRPWTPYPFPKCLKGCDYIRCVIF